MYQGKPKLKKITQVNLNNPTLYYIDNPGIHSTCEEYFLSLYLPKSSETNSSIIQVSKMRFNKQSNNSKRDIDKVSHPNNHILSIGKHQ